MYIELEEFRETAILEIKKKKEELTNAKSYKI